MTCRPLFPQGTIQARLLLKQEKAQQKQAVEEAERKRVLEEGGIPEEHMLRQQRLEQFQDMLTLFKQKQQERKLGIVEKLLREDKLNKQAKGLAKEVSQPSSEKRKMMKVRRNSVTAPTSSSTLVEHAPPGRKEEEESKRKQRGQEESSASASDTDDPPADTLHSKHVVTIVEPEIRGLWDQTAPPPFAPHRVGGQGSSEPPAAAVGEGSVLEGGGEGSAQEEGRKKEQSKAEVMIMKKAMEKLKRSKITKQVAAGREFKVSF